MLIAGGGNAHQFVSEIAMIAVAAFTFFNAVVAIITATKIEASAYSVSSAPGTNEAKYREITVKAKHIPPVAIVFVLLFILYYPANPSAGKHVFSGCNYYRTYMQSQQQSAQM